MTGAFTHHSYPFGWLGVNGCVLERPLNLQVSIKLRDQVRPRRQRRANRAIETAVRRRRIMIVFDDDRIGVMVTVHCWCVVPSESVRVDIIAPRVEVQKMSPSVVIVIGNTEEHRSVRKHGWGSRGLVRHSGGAVRIRSRVYAQCRSEAARIRKSVDVLGRDRQKYSAPVC